MGAAPEADVQPATVGNPFAALATAQGLARTSIGTLPIATQALLGDHAPAASIVSGTLPGGIHGLACDFTVGMRQARTTTTPSAGAAAPVPERAILVLTRVPEAMVLWPFLGCHDLDEQRWTLQMVNRALLEQVEFESIRFNKRYRVSVGHDQDQNLLRQLFSPAFIDALAETAPDGFYFELSRGVLCVARAGAAKTPEEIASLCEFASEIAQRIRTEALESEDRLGSDDQPVAGTPTLMEATLKDERLDDASFEQPPADVRTAAEAYRKTFSKGWRLLPFSKGTIRLRSVSLGFEAFMRGYARSRGLELLRGSAFAVRNMRAPLPGVPGRAVGGMLPGGVEGWLAACNDSAEAADHWDGMACVLVDGEERTPELRIPPALTEGSRVLGTFPVDGVSETMDPDNDPSTAAAEAPPSAVAAWLAEDEAPIGLASGPHGIAIWAPPTPFEGWSAEGLDRFCERAARGVAAVAGDISPSPVGGTT